MRLRGSLQTSPEACCRSNIPGVRVPDPPPVQPTQQDWLWLVARLKRLSPEWFSETQAMMTRKKRLCKKIRHFPQDLGGVADFRGCMIAKLASAEVDLCEKQAIVKACVKFNRAVIFAELAFVSVRLAPVATFRALAPDHPAE